MKNLKKTFEESLERQQEKMLLRQYSEAYRQRPGISQESIEKNIEKKAGK